LSFTVGTIFHSNCADVRILKAERTRGDLAARLTIVFFLGVRLSAGIVALKFRTLELDTSKNGVFLCGMSGASAAR